MKSYKCLCDERESILDEVDNWKQGRSSYSCNQRMGLWNGSTYLEELLYIRQRIEKEMIPHEIVDRMKFYKKLENKIPEDAILHIASFGDVVDKSAADFIISGVEATIEAVDRC